MDKALIEKAALHFGIGIPEINTLGSGLIHRTYLVRFSASDPIVLQCLNQATFPFPENIIRNYLMLEQYLDAHSGIRIPKLQPTRQGHYFWRDEEQHFWRATSYYENSFSPDLPGDAEEIFTAAHCFAQFTRTLSSMDPEKLELIIPGFHDLSLRFRQFEQAVAGSDQERLLKSTHIISSLRERQGLLDFFNRMQSLPDSYPRRIMHHDCKISNILFNKTTRTVLCPVDLDTVMPGYYFSDLGDMIRSMACTRDENSTEWESIGIKKQFYNAILKGYLEGMGSILTSEEKAHIHHSGLLMTCMQCLRFITDYLNRDIYYKTTYPEQNLHRALNQLILLERMEEFLSQAY